MFTKLVAAVAVCAVFTAPSFAADKRFENLEHHVKALGVLNGVASVCGLDGRNVRKLSSFVNDMIDAVGEDKAMLKQVYTGGMAAGTQQAQSGGLQAVSCDNVVLEAKQLIASI